MFSTMGFLPVVFLADLSVSLTAVLVSVSLAGASLAAQAKVVKNNKIPILSMSILLDRKTKALSRICQYLSLDKKRVIFSLPFKEPNVLCMANLPQKGTAPVDWKNEAGPIRKFLNDISVTEIMINRYDRVFVERKGVIEETEGKFDNPEHFMRFVLALAVSVGRELNRRNPFLDAKLMDGSRINIVIPPISIEEIGRASCRERV